MGCMGCVGTTEAFTASGVPPSMRAIATPDGSVRTVSSRESGRAPDTSTRENLGGLGNLRSMVTMMRPNPATDRHFADYAQ